LVVLCFIQATQAVRCIESDRIGGIGSNSPDETCAQTLMDSALPKPKKEKKAKKGGGKKKKK
jgi:hypothetical protein